MKDTQTPRTRRAEARIPDRIAIVGAGRLGTALAAALAPRASTSRARSAASAAGGGSATWCCSASPTPRSRAPRPRSPAGLLVGHCSARHDARRAGPARGVLAASADDGHCRGRAVRRRDGRDRRRHPPRAAARGAARAGAGHAAGRGRRRGSRRLPRRRLDRLELPRRRSRRSPSAWRATAGLDRELLVAARAGERGELGRARRRARADRAGRSRRRGDGRPPARRGRRPRAGALELFDVAGIATTRDLAATGGAAA